MPKLISARLIPALARRRLYDRHPDFRPPVSKVAISRSGFVRKWFEYPRSGRWSLAMSILGLELAELRIAETAASQTANALYCARAFPSVPRSSNPQSSTHKRVGQLIGICWRRPMQRTLKTKRSHPGCECTQRQQAETVMSMIKRDFGSALRGKTARSRQTGRDPQVPDPRRDDPIRQSRVETEPSCTLQLSWPLLGEHVCVS